MTVHTFLHPSYVTEIKTYHQFTTNTHPSQRAALIPTRAICTTTTLGMIDWNSSGSTQTDDNSHDQILRRIHYV